MPRLAAPTPAGATVPTMAPRVVRVVSNGKAPGSGLRLYVPSQLVQDFGLRAGAWHRFYRLPDGRFRLVEVQPDIIDAPPRRPDGDVPMERIKPELTVLEAAAVEAALVGEPAPRAVLLDVARRLRRLMRKRDWTTPDRTDDRLATPRNFAGAHLLEPARPVGSEEVANGPGGA